MLRPLLLAALLFAPAAQALTITNITAPSAPLQPETEQGEVVIEATVPCQDVFPWGAAATFTLNAVMGITFSGPSEVSVPSCQSPNGEVPIEARYTVMLSRDVPGLQAMPALVEGQTTSGQFAPLLGYSQAGEAQFVVAAAPTFLTQARVEPRLVTCDCDHVDVALHLENLGNVQTVHKVSAANASAGATIFLPDPVVLSSPLSGPGPSTKVVLLRVAVPASGEAEFKVRVDTAAAADPSYEGEPAFASFVVRRDALGPASADETVANVPLPTGPLLALGLLGLAAFVRRRP